MRRVLPRVNDGNEAELLSTAERIATCRYKCRTGRCADRGSASLTRLWLPENSI